MKYTQLFFKVTCTLTCLFLVGCKKKNNGVWDDNATAGNYKGNAKAFFAHDENACDADFFGAIHEDFVGLKEKDLIASASDKAIPQPRFAPGEAGSGIPGVESFHKPSGAEASIFKHVHFGFDEHVLRSQEDLEAVDRIAAYLKAYPNTFIFVEGHCDERGPEAYNLSLGTRRSNHVRALLIQKGVNPEKVHAVSFGKEKPFALEHNEQAWHKNRRDEFKIYQK